MSLFLSSKQCDWRSMEILSEKTHLYSELKEKQQCNIDVYMISVTV